MVIGITSEMQISILSKILPKPPTGKKRYNVYRAKCHFLNCAAVPRIPPNNNTEK